MHDDHNYCNSPGREKTAESDRRTIKALVWGVDAAGALELHHVAGTEQALETAACWEGVRLQAQVVGLPEPQSTIDQAVADKLGLDFESIEARRVSSLKLPGLAVLKYGGGWGFNGPGVN